MHIVRVCKKDLSLCSTGHFDPSFWGAGMTPGSGCSAALALQLHAEPPDTHSVQGWKAALYLLHP